MKYDSSAGKQYNAVSLVDKYALYDYLTSGSDTSDVLVSFSAGVMNWMIILK